MFNIFPCRADKIPLIEDWQKLASQDQQQIRVWKETFNGNLKYWGVPCGPTNNLLVLDADVKDGGLETIKSLHIPKTMTQRTMSGGIHYLFKYPNDGKHYGNKVKFKPGLDVRGAGGYILFYGTDDTPIADAPDWLLKECVHVPVNPSGSMMKVAPEIAKGLIESSLETIREAPAGESNNVLNVEAFKVGQLVASGNITREYAEQVLYEAAKERGKPEYEAKATIKSGIDGGLRKPLISPFPSVEPVPAFPIPRVPNTQGRWTPGYFTKYDLLNTSALKKPQLFENWSTEDIHITTADGGTGKTTLKLFEAVCLALGERFLGFNCKQKGKTLFITGEDTEKKLGAMLGAMLKQMGLFDDVPGNEEKIQTILTHIVIKKDSDLCLIQRDKQGFLHPNGDAMRKVLEAVYDIRPKMIVFDPISSFWGSESAVNDMGKAVAKFMSSLVEEGEACVEMINHMGKQSSANKDMSQFAGRGGTGLPSNARVSRVIHPVFDDEFLKLTGEDLDEKQSAMMVNVNKFTDGSPLYMKPFLVVREGYLFTRKELTPERAREAERSLSHCERIFSFIKEERSIGRYPTESVIIAHFMDNPDSIPKEATKRALSTLCYRSHMGEKLKIIDNPDATVRDKTYVITDDEGKEI